MSKSEKPNPRIAAKIVLGLVLMIVFAVGYAVGVYLT